MSREYTLIEARPLGVDPADKATCAVPQRHWPARCASDLSDPASAVPKRFRAVGTKPLAGQRTTERRANGLLRLASRAWEERARLLLFAVNGTNVFAIGLLMQVLLIRYAHIGHVPSYVAQTVFSVQMNFLLSRYLTWRDREVAFWQALLKFNVQQLAVTGLGMAGYTALEWLGVNYVIANVGVTAALTPVSFLSSHKWSLGERTQAGSHISRVPWALFGVLTVQACLSLRLVWSNTAFPDEALYLWAGQLEWQHWLHGTPIPTFSTFFSGAPIIYPPIGALADRVGGLAGARLLSLIFMLISNSLLYSVTRRIFDSRSAVFASGLYTGLAACQYLGAFATYDAMALMLTCLATWIGVRAAFTSSGRIGTTLLMVSSALLVLADATKYAAALFTPVVLAAIALLIGWHKGRIEGLRAGFVMLNTFLALVTIAIAAGGKSYWDGISTTTLARQSGSYSPIFLLYVSAKWEGALVILAVLGGVAFIFSARSRPAAMLACVLAGASLLVPIEQARIGTYTSLFKHIGYGAWFAAILAGYALASLPKAVPIAKFSAAIRVSVATVLIVGIPGIPWAASHYGWPNTSKIMPVMQRVLASNDGLILADDRGNVLDYYLHNSLGSRQVSGTFFFAYNDPATGKHLTQRAAYAAAIQQRYFSVIFLEFWDSVEADEWIQGDIDRYGGYRLVAAIPYRATGKHGEAMIWVRDRDSL
jgi:putative flippase GtrA